MSLSMSIYKCQYHKFLSQDLSLIITRDLLQPPLLQLSLFKLDTGTADPQFPGSGPACRVRPSPGPH